MFVPMMKGKCLKQGDKVGIFVPASSIQNEFRRKGLEKIRSLGLEPVEVPGIESKHGFMAKDPAESFENLQSLFSDPEIKAIWAARGGYGSNHLLPLISQLKIDQPKIIIGSSDISYILWNLMDSHLLVVFYGPMAYSSLAEGQFDRESLVSNLMGGGGEQRYPGMVIRKGFSDALISGGCLSNLVSLIGTPWFPQVEEKILLLEDINERPYRIDRMLWQLKMTGVFEKISGLVLGEFPGCFKDPEEKEFFFNQLNLYLEGTDYPVLYDLPLGHSKQSHTIPLGVNGKIVTEDFNGIIVSESAVIV